MRSNATPLPAHAMTDSAASLRARLALVAIEALRSAALFGGAVLAYFALLALLFQAGLFAATSVLFYRGILVMLLLTPLFALALAVLGERFGICNVRDAVAATLVAAALNFTVFTLGPVTVDRSISIFINGHMASNPKRVFTAAEIDRLFRDRYLTGMDQIARRMEEQQLTGTVERVGDGYRITDKGKALIANSRWMAHVFQTDKRLLEGPRSP